MKSNGRERLKETITAFGYSLDTAGKPERTLISFGAVGDYGADPIGDGTFRMIPSGDVVSFDERCRRLDALKNGSCSG